MLRLAAWIATAAVAGPILAGLAGVLLPAFGVLPALGGAGPSLDPWRELLERPGLGRSMLLSLACGLVTTALSLAVVMAFLAAADGTRRLAWARRAAAPLLAVPHAAMAVGVAFLVAPSGLVARALSPWATGWQRPPDLLTVHDPLGLAMMAGLVLKEVPFLLLVSLAALPSLDPARRLAVARTLGHRRATGWLKAVAPGLYPLIRLPVYAVVAYASSTVEVALILGPTSPPTLAVAVLRWFADPDLSMRFAASAGAAAQLAVTAAALAAWRLGEMTAAVLGRAWVEGPDRGAAERPVAAFGIVSMTAVALAVTAATTGLAMASVAWRWSFPALLPESLGLAAWARTLPGLAEALLATLAVAVPATLLSVAAVLAVLEAEARGARAAERLLYLPLLLPQLPFVFGLTAGVEAIRLPPGILPVLLGHTVFVLPYVFLTLSAAYRRHDARWTMLARTLGASRDRAFWSVRLPMLLGPCLAAAAIGFAVSVGQYLPTLLLGAGRVETVTTAAVAMASGGDRRLVGAWVLAQGALPAAAFALALLLPRLAWRHRRGLRETTL